MLADIISESGETRSAWAARIGVGKGYLSVLLNKKRIPALEVATRIERLTDGRVPASSWVPPDPSTTRIPAEGAA